MARKRPIFAQEVDELAYRATVWAELYSAGNVSAEMIDQAEEDIHKQKMLILKLHNNALRRAKAAAKKC